MQSIFKNHRLGLTLLAASALVAALVLGLWWWQLHSKRQQFTPPPPLAVFDSAPTALLGTVTAIDGNTLTVKGTPPGNNKSISLTVLVDSKTLMFKVESDFSTSSIRISDIKSGMTINVAAGAMQDGKRHAERIIIPPAPQTPAAAHL